jgi:hypothetical protein
MHEVEDSNLPGRVCTTDLRRGRRVGGGEKAKLVKKLEKEE